jgi:site-specific DNA recombinase
MTRPQKKEAPTAVRCAIYTRKSTEEGLDQDFNTLDAQWESAEAYIASQKSERWTCLSQHYDDGGFSGGNMDRPALNRLLADIAAGKVDCVVVYKVDRLSRSLLDFAKIMEVFDQRKVAFVSVTQQFNTATSMGRLMLNVLLSFGQFEREIIGERIRDKIAAQRRKGMWAGGTPILGYYVDRTGASPKLIVNATEAARVREIFKLYLSLGSLLPVVEELTRRGWLNKAWKTKKGAAKGGRPFDKGSLYALLTNPLYVGKIKHKTNQFAGEHEAIVPVEVFQKVESQLRHNGQTGGVEARNRYGALLRGLVFCKACSRTMVHNFAGQKDRQYRYYTCTHAIKSGRQQCPSRSLPAAEVERVVVDKIRCIAQDAKLRAEVLRQAQASQDSTFAELKTQRRNLERELTWYGSEIRKLGAEDSPSEATAHRVANLQDQVAAGAARLAEVRVEIERQDHERLNETDVAAAFADFESAWNNLSPREQAKVLALLVARVEFDAGDSSIAVTFHASAIKVLAKGQLGEAA